MLSFFWWTWFRKPIRRISLVHDHILIFARPRPRGCGCCFFDRRVTYLRRQHDIIDTDWRLKNSTIWSHLFQKVFKHTEKLGKGTWSWKIQRREKRTRIKTLFLYTTPEILEKDWHWGIGWKRAIIREWNEYFDYEGRTQTVKRWRESFKQTVYLGVQQSHWSLQAFCHGGIWRSFQSILRVQRARI